MVQQDRQVYLDLLARCEQAFRPFAPINLPDFFQGRKTQIDLLTAELAMAGRQVAIYGERGTGKTSLALLAGYFAGYDQEEVRIVRCERESSYVTIFGQLLAQSGVAYLPNGVETEATGGGGIGIGSTSVSGRKSSRTRQTAIESLRTVGPGLLLKHFGGLKGLLIIDEYDRVQDDGTHSRLAETLKHFSDADSQTKILVVGVAATLSDLIGEHQSITRCLAQIKLDRMKPEELEKIIVAGEKRVGVHFEDAVCRRIVALSDGFPFFTHLFCRYCVEDAGKTLLANPSVRAIVREAEFRRALRRAIESGEASLREDYQAAVITVRRKTEMFKRVLWATAYSDGQEVQVQEISQNIALLTGDKPKVESLSSYLGALTKPGKGQVLLRVRQGYYKFANPLMRAYVRLVLEDHNLVEKDGQLRFPWM
ncbi:MAG TPA: ATP-binding protein [Phycisphaerae bacterium]|nr:ATP-binding protein [Phycisphaerae bacterium]